ncbi:MAG: carboxypeptidase regulatory-like domain-containing protein, partial [Chloroflexi bacterium]|nr:carboxypeptidase regulatory-like domain-containing protein [Chloroflexota bacterium]
MLGTYSETIQIAEGQDVRIWAVRPGFTFQPEQDVWSPEPRQRSHRSVFSVIGAQLSLETAEPALESASTALPPLVQTAPATIPPQTTPAAETPTPTSTVISGSVWRLFADSPAAGVGAARLTLTVNGAQQPPVLSGIDGSYSISVPGLRPGDQLSLRAEGDEDQFDPAAYQWQAEAGVSQWSYDFYSYWGEIPIPQRDDQNRIFGRVVNHQGQGVSGAYLVVRMGTSDALQRVGPTDANGYFDGYVRLPARMMVTVWVEGGGYAPSRAQFFHAYAAENREINFTRLPPAGK